MMKAHGVMLLLLSIILLGIIEKTHEQRMCTKSITEEIQTIEYFLVKSSRRTKCGLWRRCYKVQYSNSARMVNRNVTRLVQTCCQGKQDVDGGCIDDTDSNPVNDKEVAAVAAEVMVTVPLVIVLLMFGVSVLVVYLLYTKGSGCQRIRQIIVSRRNQSVSSEDSIVSKTLSAPSCSEMNPSYMFIEKDPNSNGFSKYDTLDSKMDVQNDNAYEEMSFKKY